jgi:hypothetical protein
MEGNGMGGYIVPVSGSPSFLMTNVRFFSWSRTAITFGELTYTRSTCKTYAHIQGVSTSRHQSAARKYNSTITEGSAILDMGQEEFQLVSIV